MDFITPSVNGLLSSVYGALINNLTPIILGATFLMVGFLVIKLVFRWSHRTIRYEITSNGLSGYGAPTSFKKM